MKIESQQNRRRLGLCVACGNPADPNRVRCIACLQKASKTIAKLHAKWKAQGLCVRCGKIPPRPNRATCEQCGARMAAYQKQQREKYRRLDLCRSCGKRPPKEGLKTCQQCIDYCRNYRMGGLRTAALERDGRKCRICGREKRLTVHHIDGHGEYVPEPNHDLSNLITLCGGCHSAITRFRASYSNRKLAAQLILAQETTKVSKNTSNAPTF